jgi:hypothetical protein
MNNRKGIMKNLLRICGALLLLMFVPLVVCDAQSVEKAVSELGRDGANVDRVKLMKTDPRKAVGLLVSQLSTVSREKLVAGEKDADAEHILWSIRALRYLTGGKDFCAATNYDFGSTEEEKNRRYWLTFRHGSCLRFFALWPSRDAVYIAPRDTQEKIIAEWKSWYERNGSSYHYKPLSDPKPEQWLW